MVARRPTRSEIWPPTMRRMSTSRPASSMPSGMAGAGGVEPGEEVGRVGIDVEEMLHGEGGEDENEQGQEQDEEAGHAGAVFAEAAPAQRADADGGFGRGVDDGGAHSEMLIARSGGRASHRRDLRRGC